MILYSAAFDERTLGRALEAVCDIWAEVDDHLDVVTVLRAVEELADNAIAHSGRGGGDIVLRRKGDSVVVQVEDQGVGIHYRMAEDTEEQSVAKAFLPGPEGTSTSSSTRGGGLVLVVQYTAVEPGMTFCLYSGHACYTARKGQGRLATGSGDFHQGTLAEIVAPIYRWDE